MCALLLRLTVILSFLLYPLISNADAKQQIESRFHKRAFFIRGFYRDNELLYDSQGNVQGQPHPGPWSLGLVQIDKVDVRSEEFRLRGHRAVALYDEKQKTFRNVTLSKAGIVEITVRIATDTLSDSTLSALSGRMFLDRLTALDVPEPWRAFFTGKLISDAGLTWDQPIPDLQSEGQPVFRSGPKTGVTPPKLLVQSNPSYTEEARNMKLQGGCLLNAILNRQGLLEQIDVARPLGVGLDDSAITAVKQWRFKPADKNGQPVAVFVQVLVEFRLR